jgi:hypothetical protein
MTSIVLVQGKIQVEISFVIASMDFKAIKLDGIENKHI